MHCRDCDYDSLTCPSRQAEAAENIEKNAIDGCSHGRVVPVKHAVQSTVSMSNEKHVVQDIHDILQSYYKVCRKTFVDNVCRQAVIFHLLECDESPLALFSPVFVSQLPDGVLNEIAGEESGLRKMRAQLTKEIASLTKAAIIARS